MEPLSESTLKENPFEQFTDWYKLVYKSEIQESSAVILATCNTDLKPSVRTVLLKDHSEKGFVFFSNYESRKGQDLEQNPNASLLFYWEKWHRQVRIEGHVEKVGSELSDQYFDSRPKKSRISAIASPQSQAIEKSLLDKRVGELNLQYENTDKVPRPANWGGYILIPNYFEFWQGKDDRLHDRIVYEKKEGGWKTYRIGP